MHKEEKKGEETSKRTTTFDGIDVGKENWGEQFKKTSEPGRVFDGYTKVPDGELTDGMKLVGITFNPAGDEKVNRLKMLAAEMADIVYQHVAEQPSPLFNSIKESALREILNAQMNAVKLVTLKY